MIFDDRMNLEKWTNEVMDDTAGDETFDPNGPPGDVNWVQTGDTSHVHGRIQTTQAFASPQQSYFASIHAASENHFGTRAPHFHGGYNVGMGLADGAMEGLQPGHSGIEDDSKPSARIGGGDPIRRLQSPVVAEESDGKRHSISNDPFNSQYSLSYSMGDDQHSQHGTPGLARLPNEEDDLARDTKYSFSDALPAWPAHYNPNLVPGHSTVYPIGAPAARTYFAFDDKQLARYPPPVASVQAPVVPSPVVAPKKLKPPPLSKRRTSNRGKSKKTVAVALAPAARARTQTQSGEQTFQARRGPTEREIAEATSARGAAALTVWYERLKDLWEYKEKHGDCLVPQKHEANPSLGIWVNKQRMEKKAMDEGGKSSMTDDKEQALEEVGFVWAKRKGQASWDEKFKDLRRYYQRNGDCNVPTKYANNPALGRWVSTQRSQYKQFQREDRTHMNAERHSKLSKLGFKWNMME
jgi:hypothetical protein